MPVPLGLLNTINEQNAAAAAAAEKNIITDLLAGAKKKKGGKGNKGGQATAAATTRAAATRTATSRASTKTTAPAAISNGTTTEAGSRGNNTVLANQVGLVANTPEPQDVEYLSEVKIGGQSINLDFDTGSSDLWVFNTGLAKQANTGGHQLFDASKSPTFKTLQGATWKISYGDGSGASGTVGTDTVDIGGATVTRQAVELATSVSASFIQDTANNGLVGLALSKLNTVKPAKQLTFFDNVKPTLAEPLFTADLRKGAAGAYEFGRIDTTKFTGEMAWVPINDTIGFWQFPTSGFAIGDGAEQKITTNQAIADTGTTLLLTSSTVVQAYYSSIPSAKLDANSGGFTVDCAAQLPDLVLDVGGVYKARIKGSDINFSPLSQGSQSKDSSYPSH
jgi:hypothetical protein